MHILMATFLSQCYSYRNCYVFVYSILCITAGKQSKNNYRSHSIVVNKLHIQFVSLYQQCDTDLEIQIQFRRWTNT